MSNSMRLFIVFSVNLIIAFGFYYEQLDAGVDSISSDLANIIPVCKKMDQPSLYQDDLYLSDLEDVRYYTPFFVQSLRFIAVFFDYDYIQALNFMGLLVHLIYGISWFYFFYIIKKDFWLSLFFSLFVRGIIWPPGGELLGISEMWTIMPRTLLMAFLPIPLILYHYLKKYKEFFSFLALGLIFNFHPITGLGAIIGFMTFYFAFFYFRKEHHKIYNLKHVFLIFGSCFLGMLPYLLTYTFKVENNVVIDQNAFNEAIRLRIPKIFFNPISFIMKWDRGSFYFFLICFFLFGFFDSSPRKYIFKSLLFSCISIFLLANLSVYVEQILNYVLGSNLRMSFQLIRFQKLIIVVFQIGLFLLLIELIKKFSIPNYFKIAFLGVYCFLLMVSSHSVFSKLPLLGDDLTTFILPDTYKFIPRKIHDEDLRNMLTYIELNTAPQSIFYGTYLIRAGASRSVVLDYKGASMLIEGNPVKLMNWHEEISAYNLIQNDEGKADFLKSKNVTFVLDTKVWDSLKEVKVIGKYYLYRVN